MSCSSFCATWRGSFDIIFGETQVPGVADHAFGIVHRGAKDLPNILRWLAEYHPKTEVRSGPPPHAVQLSIQR